MKKLLHDFGVYFRSLRRNRPAGRFKSLHPKNLRKQFQDFRSRGGSFAIIGPVLLTAVGCFALFEVILTPGRAYRAVTPAASAAEPEAANDGQSPLGIVLSAFKSREQMEKDEAIAHQRAERDLGNKLEKLTASIQARLREVDRAQTEFLHRAEQIIGAPLDVNPVPDDLAWVVTLQPTAKQAWAEIHQDRISRDEIQNVSNQLNDILARTHGGKYLEDDLDRLKDLNTVLSEYASRQAEENSSLTHIGVLLETRRYQTHATPKGT